MGNLLFLLPLLLAVVDVGDLAAEVLPQLLQKLVLAGLEGGDQLVEVLFRLLDDGLCVFLKRQFGVADVQQDGLGFVELEQPFLGGTVDAGADVLGAFLDFADGVALVLVEHEAGGTDHAEWEQGYQ